MTPATPLQFTPRPQLRWRHLASGIIYRIWRPDLSRVLQDRAVDLVVNAECPGRVICVWKRDLDDPKIYEIFGVPEMTRAEEYEEVCRHD